jgi:branched-chain amino acid transport system ATP-binding protein
MFAATSTSVKKRATAVLRAEAVTLLFGGVTALSEVSLEVRNDEMLAVIGPNGAGKSSLLNVLSGFYRPQLGRVSYEGRDTRGRAVHEIARDGVVRTFQGTHLFPHMSVLDNILIGRHAHMRSGLVQAFVYFPLTRR